jgi:hypothetical protein
MVTLWPSKITLWSQCDYGHRDVTIWSQSDHPRSPTTIVGQRWRGIGYRWRPLALGWTSMVESIGGLAKDHPMHWVRVSFIALCWFNAEYTRVSRTLGGKGCNWIQSLYSCDSFYNAHHNALHKLFTKLQKIESIVTEMQQIWSDDGMPTHCT